MKCSYHPAYSFDLPANHPFPVAKYPLLRNLLLGERVLSPADILQPEPVDSCAMELIHDSGYLHRLETSGLSLADQRRLGLPWTPSLWLRSRFAAGGTMLAARAALETGIAGNLAGGTHHAFADHGEGFCVLNDVAIAIAQLRAEGAITRALVIDLDVHQGNGTASIFESVDEVFTFSIHGEHNYPMQKMRSDLDVGLPDGTGDGEYLAALADHLPRVLDAARADIAFYLAGVDVAAGDRYGRLSLSDSGIRARDRGTIDAVRSRGLPLVMVLGGGYAATPERTARLHANAFREAAAYERARS